LELKFTPYLIMEKKTLPSSESTSMTDDDYTKIVKNAIENFRGDLYQLETAIGMLAVGRRFGWRVMYLVHTRKTIGKLEKILDIKIRDVLEETSDRTERSLAWSLLKGVTNYWKAVKGEIPGIRSSETK
jgi:hypothetical protein